jgi:hypothetical protein
MSTGLGSLLSGFCLFSVISSRSYISALLHLGFETAMHKAAASAESKAVQQGTYLARVYRSKSIEAGFPTPKSSPDHIRSGFEPPTLSRLTWLFCMS